ncbi:anthranilate phosphoribosyltransferase [Thermaerobacter subterraneus]|uniref:Anthranilate phosphoribosyltransferase n=1 Tax=Thermaerobacter subterraneus DSM 13965 TaxID=867903 RepID=K6P3M8_9FIRM|nr:anthranilate phosphoribosyltransferase [Thermaerobacter subterraneus]EKP95655.1 anthranilate phosphoribosyltransferase [Thermaerobacter subterraneus DSM 13965]
MESNALQAALARVLSGRDLTAAEAEAAMDVIMSGAATPAQVAGYLVALRMKGETPAEIAGSARAMRRHATPVPTRRQGVMDTCGTGGDGRHTFNISTLAAIVAAAAGVPVAKHGNRSVSSRCGSADVLEALGVPLDLEPAALGRCLDEVGIAFLFAPRLHGAMRHAAGPRRELGIRTIFNLLGPLTNPAGARYQLLGVYAAELVEPVARVLAELGVERALVVHGAPGLDEMSVCGPTLVGRVDGDQVTLTTVEPAAAGLPVYPLEAIAGGDPARNAAIARQVLEGRRGPYRDAVIFNAAGALLAAGRVGDLREGVAEAARLLDSGAAAAKLEEWVRLAQALAPRPAGEVAG